MSKNYSNQKKKNWNHSEKIIEYKNGKVFNDDKKSYEKKKFTDNKSPDKNIDVDVETTHNSNNNQEKKYRKLSQQEQDEMGKRIYHLVKNKVNFISGTVAPAPSSKRENYLNIEDLRIGLKLITEAYSKDLVLSVQPKFMGSRCNIYLDCVNIDLSYSVSRNGYLIGSDRVNMKPIYEKLFEKLSSWITENNIKMLILDGELVPWSTLGYGLIHNDFMPVKAGLESEIEFASKYNFDANYNQMVQNLNMLVEEKEFGQMTKKTMVEKLPAHYQTYQAYLSEKPYHQDTELLKTLYSTYSKQMDLYGQIDDQFKPDYKPFGILKIIYNDGKESIPLLDGSMGQSTMYQLVSSDLESDSQLVVTIKPDSDMEQVYHEIKNWFDKKTIQEGFEGIILKPDIIIKDKIPLLKVRNPDYLTIIYGYDYKLERNYKNLVNKKTTRHKIAQSIKEFKLGLNLLTMNYSNLNSDEYKSRLENFITCELDGNNLDPRL
jgi:hypothetical protein